MRSIVYVSLFVAWWFAAIGAFRSSLLFRLLDAVPSQVRFVVGRLLCFLIVGIQVSGISIPLSLLMLLGWRLIWIASLTLRLYQWGSRSINLTSFQIGRCPVSLACSETNEDYWQVFFWAEQKSGASDHQKKNKKSPRGIRPRRCSPPPPRGVKHIKVTQDTSHSPWSERHGEYLSFRAKTESLGQVTMKKR